MTVVCDLGMALLSVYTGNQVGRYLRKCDCVSRSLSRSLPLHWCVNATFNAMIFCAFNAYDSHFEEYISLIEFRKALGSCVKSDSRVNGAFERELFPIWL